MTERDAYFANPAINSSLIKHGLKSMRHMHYMATNPQKTTDAMSMGTILHAAILEPDDFSSHVAIWDRGDKKGNLWKQFREEHADDYILKPDEHANVMRASRNVHADSMAHQLIEQTVHEQEFFWRGDQYGDAKARMDGVNHAGTVLLEVKSTASIDERKWQWHAVDFGLHLQLGWYAEGIEARTGHVPDQVWWIVFEQKGCCDVVTYEVPQGVVNKGREAAVDIARRYKACQMTGSFPGAAEGQVRTFALPDWMMGDEVDFGEGEGE